MEGESSVPGARSVDHWVLTLVLESTHHVLAVLSDGQWRCVVDRAPWPPQGRFALPGDVRRALAQLTDAALSIQLSLALDDWPWEEEIRTSSQSRRSIPRYLVDLPVSGRALERNNRLLAWEIDPLGRLEVIQSTREQGRPVAIGSLDIVPMQRAAMEHTLRREWRDPRMFSESLQRTLRQHEIPPEWCRLYGDEQGIADDAEEGSRPVTAVSIDIVDSTGLIHRRHHEPYGEMVDTFNRRCIEVTRRFHGTIGPLHGNDGVMALFGFPRAVEGAANRALIAAWHLVDELKDDHIDVRIGVASSEVAVKRRMPYGRGVHTAARIRSEAEPGQIVVAPSTRRRISRGFAFDLQKRKLVLSGLDRPMSLWSLKGLPDQSAKQARTRSTPFVGRQDELGQLRRTWSEAREGGLRWCVVRGEPGAGKSRLLQEFAGMVRARGQYCHEIVGQVPAESSPFAAIVDALRQLWNIGAETRAEDLAVHLDDPSGSPDTDREDVAALTRILLPSVRHPAAHESETAKHDADLLLDCIVRILATGPGCLLIDDAQWLDPSSIELLLKLRGVDLPHPVLAVVSERSGSAPRFAVPGAEHVDLRELTADESEALTLALGAHLSKAVRDDLVRLAQGVPLFLEESMHMLREREKPGIDQVPVKLEDLLAKQLDELGLDRALAQVVSVLGPECLAVHLDALMKEDDPFIVNAIEQGSLECLFDVGMLQRIDGTPPIVRFRHFMLRRAAYRRMSERDRIRLHGVCASLIKRVTPEVRIERPELIAEHLEVAGEIPEARDAWLAAAKLAADRHAHRETISLSRRALALIETLEDPGQRDEHAVTLHLQIATAHVALHGYGSAEAEEAYLAADRRAADGADPVTRLRIHLGLEACCVMRGNLRRALTLAEQAVAMTDWSRHPRLALQSRWALAHVHFHRGRWRAALAGFDDCIAGYRGGLLRRSGVQDPGILCLGYSSWILFELGRADDALDRIDDMLELARRLDHPFSMSVALAFAASIKRLCGDVKGAWPHAVEAVELCERGGFEVWLAHAWMVRGQLLSDLDQPVQGAKDMDRGYALWTSGGARISCATYLITRAEILLRQGDTAAATRQLADAARVSREIGELYYTAELRRLCGLAAWQAGNVGHARTILGHAHTLAIRHAKPGLALRCALSLGALEASIGETGRAADRLERSMTALTRHARSRDFDRAGRALGHWREGRPFPSLPCTPWEPA